ncbi:MAG: hypothetical protein L0Y68_01865, partial [Candidatus Dadabacteria bacterium]|nr:hypothetical protein [Candidatus Dadabacteria bacterium]
IDRIPRPFEVPLNEWLLTFPSFGFILSLRPQNTKRVQERFRKLDLVCERIGKVTSGQGVFFISDMEEKKLFWDFSVEPLIGFTNSSTTKAPRHKGGI